jgi:hypothetical protein
MTINKPITVTTHVARDFLQNAAYFNTLPKVLWEYVSNSLDNAKEGPPVNVAIEVLNTQISVADDGSGMSREDLRAFFQMHGENRQRVRGKRVRGRFGTGKCAAFGIANRLLIDTTQNGFRNVVELRRSDIEGARSGQPFPVRETVINEVTTQIDGTLIKIGELNIKRLDLEGSISYIQHHLSRYRGRARVVINGHECIFEEPQAQETVLVSAPPQIAQHLGDITLAIKVSPIPLETENNGVDILSHGIWHQTTLAGLENKEMAQYLFGEVDVPILEDKEWPIPAFDNTRNNTLNIQNPVVVILFAWISQELDKVRRKLVDAERTRRQSEEAKKLQKEASKIAEILNEDFLKLEMDFDFAKQVTARQGKVKLSSSGDQTEPLPGAGQQPTSWQETGAPHSDGIKHGDRSTLGSTPRVGGADIEPGAQPGAPRSVIDNAPRQRKGLFAIEYRSETTDGYRSRYENTTHTIIINLDHPQIAGALKAGGGMIESRSFREISYEVALVEYAIAIQYEKMDQELDPYTTLLEVRETVNRVAKRFAVVL